MSIARRQPKQYRGQRKVEHILEIGARLFAKFGYENVSTRDIADQAGISIGSVYQFFSDKKNILEALSLEYHKKLVAFWQSISLIHPKEDKNQIAEKLFVELTNFDRKNPEYLKIFSFSGPTFELESGISYLDSVSIQAIQKIFSIKTSELVNHFWKYSQYIRLKYLKSRNKSFRDGIRKEFQTVFLLMLQERVLV